MPAINVKTFRKGRDAARLSLTFLLLIASANCTKHNAKSKLTADDLAAAKVDIQKALDQKRQCAPLLTGSEPIDLPPGAEKRGGTKALLDAGLIARAPATNTLYQTTPQAAPDVVKWGPKATLIDLCYGRRKVTQVESLPLQDADTGPAVRYRYRIVDAPDWTSRPETRAAFPFLEAAHSREFVSRDRVRITDGHAQTAALTDELDMIRPIEFFTL